MSQRRRLSLPPGRSPARASRSRGPPSPAPRGFAVRVVCPRGQTANFDTRGPDQLERKLARAQGGYHKTPPLIRRIGLVVAPAAVRGLLTALA
jgi:hypothetical protein